MFQKPNYHNVPNEFVDTYLKELSGAETKIIAVVMRKTFGFHKDFDYLSISQLMEYTGLSNRQIINSTQSLIEKDLIYIKYQCPKCNLESVSIQKDFICTECQTHEKPNKLFSILINEENQIMEKTMDGGHAKISIGSEITSQPMEKISRGSEITSQPMEKISIGCEVISHTKCTEERERSFFEAKKALSLSQETFIRDPAVESEKNVFEKKRERENFFSEKDMESEFYQVAKKIIERIYPMFFSNAQGGIMNKVKSDMMIEIGMCAEINSELVIETISTIASSLKNPESLIKFSYQKVIPLFKGEQRGN